MTGSFNGFPKQCVEFLTGLAANNNREWFEKHKPDFENYVMEPVI